MLFDVYHGSASDRLTPSSASSFPANVWTHVAVVQSRASLTATYGPAQIYWNGVSVATTASFRFPLPVSRSNLWVGKSNWGSYHPMFTGQMKDLLVWDVALSPAQLDGVRLGGGLPSTPAPLISMMRTWCGAAPPPSPPLLPPPPPSPPPPPPLCAVDGAYTFTGAATSYLTATSRTGLVLGAESVLYASPPSFPGNVWTHVAVVQSRASLTDTYGPAQIYWNGASVATTSSMRFPLPVSRSNLYVGKSNWAGEGTFTGQMKDLLVWDVALSPAQLDGVRLRGGLPSTPAPLVSMMRTWCGAAPPPSPPLLPPPPPSPPPPPPLCAVDGAYTFTGAATSYLTATSRTGLVGGGLGFTLCAWVYRT
eukprot:jgi/Chrpa1/25248/Chrysochromulina_OHIO_Genome00025752-RA